MDIMALCALGLPAGLRRPVAPVIATPSAASSFLDTAAAGELVLQTQTGAKQAHVRLYPRPRVLNANSHNACALACWCRLQQPMEIEGTCDFEVTDEGWWMPSYVIGRAHRAIFR